MPSATVDQVKTEQVFARLSRGEVANIRLADLVRLVEALGFIESGRRGSHRVFARSGIAELINLQDDGGGDAERYQARQVAALIRRYHPHLEER